MDDPFMAADVENLPGGWKITYGAVRQWRKGVSFDAFDEHDERHTIEPAPLFGTYFRLWERYHHFGLPHGGGWIDEPEWLLDLFQVFDQTLAEVERYRSARR